MFKTDLKRVLAALVVTAALIFPAAAAAKGNKNGMKNSPFLITKGLPHYTMILKKRWDDPKLALTPEQKTELLKVRKTTLGSVMALKPEIMKLQKKIVKAAMSGAAPKSLGADVERLAKLKADATRTHLKCIYDTRRILTPAQLDYINSILHRKHKH
ncbi:hypothetical protein NNO_1590 [Hydrogenimonas sp.]|nr:hypothetical protein NNO_1590 [Hydrogenimonas sp.]